jgi:hypothetical protein
MAMIKLTILLIAMVYFPIVSAQTITKCQDEDGKWHYGDYAAEECARSRITEIHQSGEEINQINAPPTTEELEAKQRMEQKLAEEKRSEVKQQQSDERLLSTYDSVDSIVRARDALLASIDGIVEAEQDYKQKLEQKLAELATTDSAQTGGEAAAALRQQIQEFEDSIRNRLVAREQARVRYDNDLSRYQQLVNDQQ